MPSTAGSGSRTNGFEQSSRKLEFLDVGRVEWNLDADELSSADPDQPPIFHDGPFDLVRSEPEAHAITDLVKTRDDCGHSHTLPSTAGSDDGQKLIPRRPKSAPRLPAFGFP